MASKQHVLRERVVNFYELKKSMGKKFTVEHFMAERVARSTIYSILRTCQINRKVGSGKLPTIMSKNGLQMLKRSFNNRDNQSQRQAAKKFNCSQVWICKSLKKLQVQCRKKQKSPDYTNQIISAIKSQCRWMAANYGNLFFVLDDECYFPLSNSRVPGNDRFYSNSVATSPPNIRYKFQKKYEKKLMLYIVISEKGVSKPWFKDGGLAINQIIYQEECLSKILIPFLRDHHSDGNFVFWPDKASSHYAKKTQDFLKAKEIPFVPKDRNPTNLPQCRPIEDFFGILKSLVYKNNWRAKNFEQLKKRIRLCLKKIDTKSIQEACRGIRTKLRLVADHGPYSVVH